MNIIDSSLVLTVQASIGEEMKMDGWISIILNNRVCIVLKFGNGVFHNEGYVLNDEKVMKAVEKEEIDCRINNKESIEEGIVDLDHGSRFEGLVLKQGNTGIPFGFGEMYDDDGLLVYKGIMVDWKRFGYGVSYHDNGLVEYEGYWCDDKRCGSGKLYDRSGKLVKEGGWWNGMEYNSDDYIGDGSQPININTKHLKLENNCVLKDWDASLLCNLKSIEIGDDSFGLVKTFRIEGLRQLKSLKVGKQSFTQIKVSNWDNAYEEADNDSKSFHLLNCESLESLEIGELSFSDFGGQFELKNLPALQSIKIGEIKEVSCNFYWSSLVVRGFDNTLALSV